MKEISSEIGKGIVLGNSGDSVTIIRFFDLIDPKRGVETEIVAHERGKTIADYLSADDLDYPIILSTSPIDQKDVALAIPAVGETITVCKAPQGGIIGAIVGAIASAVVELGVIGVIQVITTVASVVSAIVGALQTPDELPDSEDRKSYGYKGAVNTRTEDIPIPIVYGTYRVGGNVVGIKVANVTNEIQELHLMMCVNDGEIGSISDVHVNGQVIENSRNWTWAYTLGNDKGFSQGIGWDVIKRHDGTSHVDTLHETGDVPNFNDSATTVAVGTTLSDGSFVEFTTSKTVNAVAVNIEAPGGIYKVSKKGDIEEHSVPITAQYRLSGSTGEWLDMSISADNWASNTGDLGAAGANNVYVINGIGTDRFTDESSQFAIRMATPIGDLANDIVVENQNAGDLIMGSYGSMGFYGSVGKDIYVFEVFDLSTGLPVSKALTEGKTVNYGSSSLLWELNDITSKTVVEQIKQPPGQGIRLIGYRSMSLFNTGYYRVFNDVTGQLDVIESKLVGSVRNALFWTFRSRNLSEGIYDVRVKRDSPEDSSTKIGDTIKLSSVSEIETERPNYSGTAMFGVKLQMSEVFSGMPDVSYLVNGRKVRVWNGSSWVFETSSNPAWTTLDMLTGSAGSGMSDDMISMETFVSWADFCTENNLTFDAIVETQSTVWDSIQPVLVAGHAQIVNSGTRYGIVINRADIPVMLFGDGNVVVDTMSETWLPTSERANEIEVVYFDKDDRYRRKVVKVFDSQTVDADRVSAQIIMLGVTDRKIAEKEAYFRLNQNKFITKSISFSSTIESIACGVGDIINVKATGTKWSTSGRVAGEAASNLVSIGEVFMYDQAVIDEGARYKIAVISSNALLLSTTVSSSDGSVVFLQSAISSSRKAKRVIVNGTNEYEIYGQSANSISVKSPFFISSGDSVEIYSTDVTMVNEIDHVASEGSEFVKLVGNLEYPVSEGCVWVTGVNQEITGQYRITDVAATDDPMYRDITATEYKDEMYLFTDHALTVTNPNVFYTRSENYGEISQVQELSAASEPRDNGLAAVTVSWKAPAFGKYGGAKVIYNVNSPSTSTDVMVSSGSFSTTIENLSAGDSVFIIVVAIDEDGVMAPISSAPNISIVAGLGNYRTAYSHSELNATPRLLQIALDWDIVTSDDNSHTEIWYSDRNSHPGQTGFADSIYNATLLGSTNGNSFVHDGVFGTNEYAYWVKRVNKVGSTSLAFPVGKGVIATPLTNFTQLLTEMTSDFKDSSLWADLIGGTSGLLSATDGRIKKIRDDIDASADALLENAMANVALREDVIDAYGRINISDERIDDLSTDSEGVLKSVKILALESAGTRAAIASEAIVRINDVEAIASVLRVIENAVNDNNARIATEEITRASDATALASKVISISASTANASSEILQEATTRATEDRALALLMNNLAISFGDSNEAAQTQEAYVVNGYCVIDGSVDLAHSTSSACAAAGGQWNDGIMNKYSIKMETDINGKKYIAGFGLTQEPNEAGGLTSNFVVLADKFAIADAANPGSDVLPFMVSGGVVYMNNAVIRNLTADNITANSISGDRIKAGTSITSPIINAGVLESGIIKLGSTIVYGNTVWIDSISNYAYPGMRGAYAGSYFFPFYNGERLAADFETHSSLKIYSQTSKSGYLVQAGDRWVIMNQSRISSGTPVTITLSGIADHYVSIWVRVYYSNGVMLSEQAIGFAYTLAESGINVFSMTMVHTPTIPDGGYCYYGAKTTDVTGDLSTSDTTLRCMMTAQFTNW